MNNSEVSVERGALLNLDDPEDGLLDLDDLLNEPSSEVEEEWYVCNHYKATGFIKCL